MATNGKEYKLAIRIAGIVDKSYNVALTSASANMKSFKATMTSMDNDFKKLDKGFDRVMRVGKTCFHTIATAAGVAAVAVGAVTAAAIKLGSDFEAEMSTVKSISGATASEMEELTEKAREVAKNTVFSATEIGSAMEYMGMASWKASQMIVGLDGVVALAAASGEDMAMVSDIVTDSLTAMGQGAEQATHFADVMAQAAMNSNTNVELMGESFKYVAPVAGALEYSMEDLTIAIGLTASSGIKGSLAGTALRNMLTRMAKPTKESRDAMEALGLSLMDEEGRMYSLLEIMQMLRQNFAEGSDTGKMQEALQELAGLTDEQIEEVQSSLGDLTAAEEAFYAAELGGQRGMSGLLAIANSSDEEFLKLTEAIYNAEGAAEEMSKIRLDNLQGDVTILKDTLADAGIELYYQFNDELRGIVHRGTELIDAGAVKIPNMFRKISTEFPTLKRKFTKFAEPVLNGIVETGRWIVKNRNGIISAISGIGASMATYKIASTGVHFINTMMSITKLNPVTGILLGVTAAVGGVTAAFAAYKQQERELINENLDSHFGNIALSMEELQKAAEYIIQTDSLGAVREALEAFDGLDEYKQIMDQTVSDLNMMNWKISIGMELDENDQESYQKAIEDYVEAAQDYALQGRYAVSLSLSATLDEGDLEQSNIVDKINHFYSDKYNELQGLGTRLKDTVTDAFNDGLFEIEEVDKIIELQQQMAEIEKQLALGEYEATLSAISLEFTGTELTADSYKNMLDELNAASDKAAEAYKDTYIKNYAAIKAAYEAGKLTDDEYMSALEYEKNAMNNGIAETHLQAMSFAMNTIYDLYGEDIKKYNEAANAAIAEYGANADDGVWEYAPGAEWYRMEERVNQEAPDDITRKAINDLMVPMQDQIDWLDSMMAEWDNLPYELQEELAEMRDRVLPALGAAGAGDNQTKDLWQRIANMSEYDGTKMKNWVDELYDDYFGYAYENAKEAADQLTSDTQQLIDENFANGFDVTADVRIELVPAATLSGLDSVDSMFSIPHVTQDPIRQEQWNAFQRAAARIDHNATGNIIRNKELSWIAENGPESVIPLDGSTRAVSLWEQTGRLLGIESITDRFDLSGAAQQNTVSVEYNPTFQFYGEAPTRQDLVDASRMSQDEFNEMLENYLSGKRRVSFT